MQKRMLAVILGMFFISLVLASITITQPYEIYNFGDQIFTTVTVNPLVVSGSFEIKLVCGNSSATVYKISPADSAFFPNQEQKITHKIVLTKEFIGELSGDCNILANLGTENIASNAFFLTREIDVSNSFDRTSYNPSEKVYLSLVAKKANGVALNGFVELSGVTTSKTEVVNGIANLSFSVPENLGAGNYPLNILVYDRDGFGVLNQKNILTQIVVNQVPRSLTLNLPGVELNPGDVFDYSVDMFDQTGNKMFGNVLVSLVSPDGKQISNNVQSGVMSSFPFYLNSLPGRYKIVASQGNIKQEKEFSIREVAKVDVSFFENSAIVKNIGNVPFFGSVDFNIGGEQKSVEVSLLIGEEKKFSLKAPTGVYDVNVRASEGSTFQRQISLTGRAVSVKEAGGVSFIEQYNFIWYVLGGIVLLIGLILFFRFKQTSHIYGEKIKEDRIEDVSVVSARAHMKKQFLDVSAPQVDSAESSLSMKGSKDYCSVVSVCVKNHSQLNPNAISSLTEILNDVKGKFGVIDWRGSHALIILSPLVTKTYKNELVAVQIAEKIVDRLNEYNRKFANKISFGVGVHAGEMVSSVNAGKLNYTSLGNSILLAKKISDLSEGKLYVSANFRQKLMRELKVNKLENVISGESVFEVLKIANVEANQDKLKDLMKRNSFSTGNFN